MEMRRYVRHSPAWWIVGGILALLTAGCIVLVLLAQRDSAAAEAVPIGDEIYLGDYNYIDVQYMTTWAYRVTLGRRAQAGLLSGGGHGGIRLSGAAERRGIRTVCGHCGLYLC